jgi:hypothetical protein
MEVKEAIARAKTYVSEVFGDEGISDVRLEEVEFDEAKDFWNITIGFFRQPEESFDPLTGRRSRMYKTVVLSDDTGKIISIKHREFAI